MENTIEEAIKFLRKMNLKNKTWQQVDLARAFVEYAESVHVSRQLSAVPSEYDEMLKTLETLHSPFIHDFIGQESKCRLCQLIKRAKSKHGIDG